MVEMLNRAEGTLEGACCACSAHTRQRARTARKRDKPGRATSDGDEPLRDDDVALLLARACSSFPHLIARENFFENFLCQNREVENYVDLKLLTPFES